MSSLGSQKASAFFLALVFAESLVTIIPKKELAREFLPGYQVRYRLEEALDQDFARPGQQEPNVLWFRILRG